ncbi:MAG: hypothetical protein ACW99G_14715 [Candidatus Thorarchaeota archaeon]|jgi:hypothetical protein
MVITFPEGTEETIDAIREAIGRNISFVTASAIACTASGCGLDPVTNTGTNSFCVTCSGLYWIPVLSNYTVKAHVTWGNADELNWVTGGQLMDGDARAQVKYTAELLNVLDGEVERVEIDGKNFEIKSKIYRGVPELNRVLIDLIEKE